jgi:hypothetical protein
MKALKNKLMMMLLISVMALTVWPATMTVLASDQTVYTTIKDPIGFSLQIISPKANEEIYGDGVKVELTVTNASKIHFYDNGQLILTIDVNESGTIHRTVVLPIHQIGQHQITITAVSLDDQSITTTQSIVIYYMGDPSAGGILPPNTGVFRISDFVVTNYVLMVASVVVVGAVVTIVVIKRRRIQS